jgi:Transposase domain (DUF772)
MLRDRYDPVDLFALFPQLGLTMEPALAQFDRLLDDDQLFANGKASMARRHRYTLCQGRSSTPVEVVLRLLVVQHLYNWSFAETEHFVSDSLVLRQFCRLGWERAPDDTTLIRWAQLIGPQTLEQLNERAVELARQHKVTRGRPRKRPNKLRVDTTVVATHIPHPTDSGLLGDGVRVLSRLVRRAKGMLAPERVAALGQAAFRSHTKTVRRLAQPMHRIARRRGEEAVEALKEADARLIAVARQSVREAQRAGVALQPETARGAQRLWGQLQQFVPLVEQGIQQAFRRVIAGEVMPAKEKLLSVFEPHTQVIPRHKAGKEVEFGRKLWPRARWKAASSRAGGFWKRAAGRTSRIWRPAYTATESAWAKRHICWQATGASRRGRTSSWLGKPASSGSCCRVSAGQGRSGGSRRRRALSGGAMASGQAWRDASACCAVASGGTAASIPATRGWGAGSAGGSSPPICCGSPACRRSAQPVRPTAVRKSSQQKNSPAWLLG